ncbi:MAG: hypothetical protein RJQ21_08300 [Rhodospirillales bacterium]
MRYAVYIGATGGPVRIERFVAEGTPLSEVFVGRAVEPLVSMATAFDNFMRPGRPPEKLFGLPGNGGWRMDISAPIDSGDSWELAVLIAFGLAREGRLARPGEPADAAIWLTGRVNADLHVGAVGHVAGKLVDSRAQIDDMSIPCTCFVPLGADIADERVIEVSGAAEIAERLGIDVDAVRSAYPRRKRVSPSMKVAVATLALMLLGTTVTVGFLDDDPGDTEVAIEHSAGSAVPAITVTALRPASGSSCAAVHFSSAPPVREKLSPGNGRIELKADRTLCGLGVAVDSHPGNRPGSTFAAFNSSRPAEIHGQPGEQDAPVRVDGHHEWSAMLPAGIFAPFEMVVTAVGEGGNQPGSESLTVRVAP